MILDNKLTSSNHVTFGTQRALNRFSSVLPEDAKLKLVQAVVTTVILHMGTASRVKNLKLFHDNKCSKII